MSEIRTAKLFTHGRSQAVRLPKEFRLPGKEVRVRRELGDKPMYGLYPENRPSKAPTGVRLIEAFEFLCVILVTQGDRTTRHLGELDDTQREILRLLHLTPEQLSTFKRRCGT